MNKIVKNLFWHDGNLVEMRVLYPSCAKEKSCISIVVDLYASEDASRRYRHELIFNDVLSVHKATDMQEFADNACAGTIDRCDLSRNSQDENVFALTFVFGGYLEIVFQGSLSSERK